MPAPRSPRRSGQVLRPYLPSLIRRWREGIADSMRLWREIQAQGDTHSARTGCRLMTRLRRAADAGQVPEAQSPVSRPAPRRCRPVVTTSRSSSGPTTSWMAGVPARPTAGDSTLKWSAKVGLCTERLQ
jgi:hypothetical protein